MSASATTTSKLTFEEYLLALGYTDLKPIPGNRFACLMGFMFTHAIIVVEAGDTLGYDDRWCYHDYEKAKAALDAWDGNPGTEPVGWHRHPDTGRRRDETGAEWINR